ncbi:unnamed protein product [Schistosoma guineensis]|nr:unnamed protein product [Schistosoma guineensis]
MEITFLSFEFSGKDLPVGPLIDLLYTDDGEKVDKMQSLLVALSNNARLFRMRSCPSKCKLLLQDWHASTTSFILKVRSALMGWCLTKVCLAFANLDHLWRRRDIRLSIKR